MIIYIIWTKVIFEKEFFTHNNNIYAGIINYDERSSSDEDDDEDNYIVVELEKNYLSSVIDIIGPYEITEWPIKIVNKNDMVMITTTSFIGPE